METLSHKIDFALVLAVDHANPNGDPLNGNRPRENYDGHGEISDVCLKRKIRNRMMDLGQPVFVQSDDRCQDGFHSLLDRAKSNEVLAKAKAKDSVMYAAEACRTWLDVRSFGQVFAFKGSDVSVGVRGPVSIHPAFSVDPVDITSLQITKSVNSIPGDKKSSDTMGTKHRVDFGVYVTYGSINCQLAEKTGFSDEDASIVKEALLTLFENDASSARPEGSMEVVKLIWWEHNCKSGQYSSAKVHRCLKVERKVETPHSIDDYSITVCPLEGLQPEVLDGR
ncbi:type I-C CRISPR-associated protein Cas7/Csd2 [[Clostridium] leptum]|uniref:Type I-C CRISPR-associated protein Cas7/Csd2 n=1 Tax=Solibaculum mannosilyticum TaxID=2780922 RepID=A0A7I8D2G4_9FIRM|nr:type I-C CRISPR-associated protein Cas7/Csd2 [Solibaculum mannosilyticum]MCO7137816.1 type I-C CRISPR-associated protein Cas7/Csd2 [[Clostridium] leptum]BCI61020.1 type I-C CRISPR-associated protein Cas7/Csd2 [Solibaculum mannosilyticum]